MRLLLPPSTYHRPCATVQSEPLWITTRTRDRTREPRAKSQEAKIERGTATDGSDVTRRLTTTEQGYGWAWQQLRLRILARDQWVCHWCGGTARSVDHLTPKADGGADDPANLVASCIPCNSRRSLEWIIERRRGFFKPPRAAVRDRKSVV